MTSSTRRLGGQPAGGVRLSPRARAILAARHAGAPARQPRGRAGQAIVTILLVGLLVVGALGSAVSLVAANLPDPSNLAGLTFDQPTVIYDRTGKVQLARFELQNRRVITFDEVPKLVLDATTTAEDRTFWENGGFDPGAIIAAAVQNASGGADERGASTITQQLVRAQLGAFATGM